MRKLQCLMNDAMERSRKRGLSAKGIAEAREKILTKHLYAKDPETVLASCVVNGLYSPTEICEIYRKYNANDDHLMSLGKAVIRETEKGEAK